MERQSILPRPDWKKKVESIGFPAHTMDGQLYWDESACYVFTPQEIEVLETATNELHERCLEAVDYVINRGIYDQLNIPPHAVPIIEASWNAHNGDGLPSIYGRMDLFYDGSGPPKLLEYNADTPTALIEASLAQWDWKEETDKSADQWNSIHERLVDGWKDLAPYLQSPLYFSGLDTPEDVLTVSYLQDTAARAGLKTKYIEIRDIGHDGKKFVDLQGFPIHSLFKLYPWEWMVREDFGKQLVAGANWIEPAWKMILSNKGILPLLWSLNPGHPNLLPASREEGHFTSYAKKPRLSREGSNIQLWKDGKMIAEGPDHNYGTEGFIYQQLVETTRFGGKTPIIGSWLIQGTSAGCGVRESDGPITSNTSRFIPHKIVGGNGRVVQI